MKNKKTKKIMCDLCKVNKAKYWCYEGHYVCNECGSSQGDCPVCMLEVANLEELQITKTYMKITKTFEEADYNKPISLLWPLFLPVILIVWLYFAIGNWLIRKTIDN